MNNVLLDLGFIKIYWYSVIMLFAIMIGIFLAYKEIKKKNIDKDFFFNLVFYTVVFAILGARLYYVIFNLDYYIKYPLEIFAIWEGGLAIHGGILAGCIFVIYYTRKKEISTLRITDIIAPSLILGQALGRWGNFFNQEAHGPLVSKSFLENLHIPNFIIEGMHINGDYYHPTFLYESIWNFLGFIILIVLRKTKKLKTGQLTGIYFMWYSLARFFIEALRTDSLMLGNFKIAQIISIVLFIFGLIMVIICNKEKRINKIHKES